MIGSFLIDKAKQSYGIPADAQYVSVDIVPDDATQPHATRVVTVGEEDFWTVVDEGRLPDIKPENLPRTTMNEREFSLLGVVGATAPSRIEYARDLYGISKDPKDPQNDQYAPRFALIDIASDDPNAEIKLSKMMKRGGFTRANNQGFATASARLDRG